MFRATLPPVLALGLMAGLYAPTAKAADYLRGSYAGETAPQAAAGPDWAGFYAGVHAGASVSQSDLRKMADPLSKAALPNSTITDLLANTINFKDVTKMGPSYGAFTGVNWLWDDVVLGVEADYTRSSIKTTSTAGPYGLIRTVGTEEWGVTSTSTARANVSDWGTLRARAGWATGMFLPYLTAGVAFGNVDGRATTSGSWTRTDVSAPPARTLVDSGTFSARIGKREINYGSTIGAGLDMQIMPGAFLRAEFQHVQLYSISSGPAVSFNTARVGGGVKF
jgi:outer membrane immunogenic protein